MQRHRVAEVRTVNSDGEANDLLSSEVENWRYRDSAVLADVPTGIHFLVRLEPVPESLDNVIAEAQQADEAAQA